MTTVKLEYIWLDARQNTRSKTKVFELSRTSKFILSKMPIWKFDGSSTDQAKGHDSDCPLLPVALYPDPIRGKPHLLVLCEVLNKDGGPHKTNMRVHLRRASERYAKQNSWFGIEQEYVLYNNNRPLGWPKEPNSYPGPQGPYYCGVGANRVAGRELVEEHLDACLKAGIKIAGINAEVMLGQWEFQVGPLGSVETADHLTIARWLLQRLGERYGISVSFDPKPVSGDWNGSGGHANFSTKDMRETGGLTHILNACKKLSEFHQEHIAVYGENNDKRLTGKHETCDINTFRWGYRDRGASIRIPLETFKDGYGYLEDRRPAANLNPYLVCLALLETVCGKGFDPKSVR